MDRPSGHRPSVYLACAIVAGIFAVGIVFFPAIGFRPDIDVAIHTVRFIFKFIVLVPLALLSTAGLFYVSQPMQPRGDRLVALLIPVAGLILGVIIELAVTPESAWFSRMIGTNSRNCLSIIPALSIFPLAGFMLALKQAAPSNPGFCGAIAGLAASGIAAVFYASNCFDDSPLFVVLWYPIAMGAVVLTGYLVGRKWLRW